MEGSYTADHCNSGNIPQTTTVKPVVSKIAYGYVQGVSQPSYNGPSMTNNKGTITIIDSWNTTKINANTVSANDSNYVNPTRWSYQNYDLTQH